MTVVVQIPWPELPMCECGAEFRVLLRDWVGAELECAKCGAEKVTWHSREEQFLLRSSGVGW